MSSETHVDELALWYVAGTLAVEERTVVETHLETCDSCRAAFDDARILLGAMAASDAPIAPAPAVKRNLMARVDSDLGLAGAAPVRQKGTAPVRRPQGARTAPVPRLAPTPLETLRVWWRRLATPLAIGGVALALVLLLWNVNLQNQLANAQAELSAFVDPGVRVASLGAASQALPASAARLYANPLSRTAVLTVFGLKPLNADQTYELWLIRNGQPVAAGTFAVNSDGSGRLLVQSQTPIGEFDQAGITIERAGGSATPTMSALVFVGSIR